jgi:hypothetical protein
MIPPGRGFSKAGAFGSAGRGGRVKIAFVSPVLCLFFTCYRACSEGEFRSRKRRELPFLLVRHPKIFGACRIV